MTVSRVQAASHGVAGPPEIACVVLLALTVWRLVLGWDWASISDGSVRTPPQSTPDWVVLGSTAMVAVGWLGLRGRGVLGTIAVCLPITALSGWRMATSAVVNWPIGLASLVFVLSAACMAAAAIGAGLRRLQV